VEFFYEAVLYAILISIPIVDMIKSDHDSKAKAKAQAEKEAKVNASLEQAHNRIDILKEEVNELKRQQQIQANILASLARTKRLIYLDLLS
jgi:hypothetical protein